jgi:hypothetical protein
METRQSEDIPSSTMTVSEILSTYCMSKKMALRAYQICPAARIRRRLDRAVGQLTSIQAFRDGALTEIRTFADLYPHIFGNFIRGLSAKLGENTDSVELEYLYWETTMAKKEHSPMPETGLLGKRALVLKIGLQAPFLTVE